MSSASCSCSDDGASSMPWPLSAGSSPWSPRNPGPPLPGYDQPSRLCQSAF